MGYEGTTSSPLWNLLEYFNYVGIDRDGIWTFATKFLRVLVGQSGARRSPL